MRSISRLIGLFGIIAVAGLAINAQAQKVYVADNATTTLVNGWDVKVFNNGVFKYLIDHDQGVTHSPRGVAGDSTGSIYVMHLSPQGPNLARIDKFTPNAAGTDAFKHSQAVTSFGNTGPGGGYCNWGVGDARRVDVDLSDDTVLVADAGGTWNTTCLGGAANSAPGGRGPGSYGVIHKYQGAGGVVIDSSHTTGIGLNGLGWHNHSGNRTPQSPGVHVDQSNGDVYVGSGWNSDPSISSQQVQRFSSALVEISRFDVNAADPNLDTRTNKADSGALAVNQAGEVWVVDHMLNPANGGWGSPMGRLTKYDSSGNILTTKIGTTVISGSARNNFSWGGGLDVDEANVLWVADSDRIIRLDGSTGDFIDYAFGDTEGQNDTNTYGMGAFAGAVSSLEQIWVGALPPVGSSIRIQ